MVRVPTNRIPTHPGEMLLEEFLTPMGITQKDLADNVEPFEDASRRPSPNKKSLKLNQERAVE
jgi:hypothetical protein